MMRPLTKTLSWMVRARRMVVIPYPRVVSGENSGFPLTILFFVFGFFLFFCSLFNYFSFLMAAGDINYSCARWRVVNRCLPECLWYAKMVCYSRSPFALYHFKWLVFSGFTSVLDHFLRMKNFQSYFKMIRNFWWKLVSLQINLRSTDRINRGSI